METRLLRVFQKQVLLQCDFLLAAASQVNAAVDQNDACACFFALQNFLNAGANIAKALWGSGGKRAEARKPLRDTIGIDDNSPLRQVGMRNNFEHFDERLERWWDESRGCYIDLLIRKAIFVGSAEIDKFRQYDPTTTNLTFWGEDFNLQEIISEVRRILPRLEREAATPHWDDPPHRAKRIG